MDPELDLVRMILESHGVNRKVGQTFGTRDANRLDLAVGGAREELRDSLVRRDPAFQEFMSILVQTPEVGMGLRDDLISQTRGRFFREHAERGDSLIASAIGLPMERAPRDLHDSSLAFYGPARRAQGLRSERDAKNESRRAARVAAREADIAQQEQNLNQYMLMERKEKNATMANKLIGPSGSFIANLLTR